MLRQALFDVWLHNRGILGSLAFLPDAAFAPDGDEFSDAMPQAVKAAVSKRAARSQHPLRCRPLS